MNPVKTLHYNFKQHVAEDLIILFFYQRCQHRTARSLVWFVRFWKTFHIKFVLDYNSVVITQLYVEKADLYYLDKKFLLHNYWFKVENIHWNNHFLNFLTFLRAWDERSSIISCAVVDKFICGSENVVHCSSSWIPYRFTTICIWSFCCETTQVRLLLWLRNPPFKYIIVVFVFILFHWRIWLSFVQKHSIVNGYFQCTVNACKILG